MTQSPAQTRGGQGQRVEGRGQEEDKRQSPAPQPRHRVDRVQGRGQEKDNRGQGPATKPGAAKRRDKAWTQSPATESRGGQGLDTEPSHRVEARPRGGQEESHRVDRVQGRGQEEDKTRRRPSHREQPQSPATELTEFRGAAKRRTRGGQGPATELSHRATEPSHRVQGRGQ